MGLLKCTGEKAFCQAGLPVNLAQHSTKKTFCCANSCARHSPSTIPQATLASMDAASERKKQPSLNQDDERNAAFQRKQVHFEGTQNAFQASNPGAASPTGVSTTKLTAAGSVYSNDLFSGSWTIEAQRTGRMDLVDSGSTPASSTAAYTPASTGYLESARKVDDLRGRLEGLEQALKEMESKAVAHLDKQLQEKVLATAGEACAVVDWC